MKAIVLKYFKPQKNVISLDGITIKFIKSKDLESIYGNRIDDSVRASVQEWQVLAKKQGLKETENWGNLIFPVVEYSNDEIPSICVKSLFELVFNIWMHCLESNRELNLSLGEEKECNVPYVSLTQKNLKLIKEGYKILNGNKNENKRFKISLQRWSSSYIRSVPLDSVLDCCSSLEALLSFPNELRLRFSFSVYHILRKNKKASMLKIYEMYGVRNSFIHGGRVPKVSKNEQEEFIRIVANVLLQIIKNGNMPKSNVLSKKIIEQYA